MRETANIGVALTMAKYAEGTSVGVERSIAEIRKVLEGHLCTGFMYGEQNGTAGIGFVIQGCMVRITIPLPNRSDPDIGQTPTGRKRSEAQSCSLYEAEVRRRWRVLVIAIKAKLELIKTGISSVQHEFLADYVLPDGRTLGEHVLPNIETIRQTGRIPRLLPGPAE